MASVASGSLQLRRLEITFNANHRGRQNFQIAANSVVQFERSVRLVFNHGKFIFEPIHSRFQMPHSRFEMPHSRFEITHSGFNLSETGFDSSEPRFDISNSRIEALNVLFCGETPKETDNDKNGDYRVHCQCQQTDD